MALENVINMICFLHTLKAQPLLKEAGVDPGKSVTVFW